jgi:hypothetical protein
LDLAKNGDMTALCRLLFPERIGIKIISTVQPFSFLHLQIQPLHHEQQSIAEGSLGNQLLAIPIAWASFWFIALLLNE